MTHAAARQIRSLNDDRANRSLFTTPDASALQLAPAGLRAHSSPACAARATVSLRNPDLVADLRQARAARFASRYEWLALRRRRAQIAARHALETA